MHQNQNLFFFENSIQYFFFLRFFGWKLFLDWLREIIEKSSTATDSLYSREEIYVN